MDLMLYIFALILICVSSGYVFFKNRRHSNQPPGPWNLPLLGYLHKLDPQQPYLTLTKLSQKYGPIFSIKLGVLNTVVVAESKLLKKILLKDECLGRPPIFVLKTVTESKGLLFSQGDLWKDQRKFVVNFLRSLGVAKISSKKKFLEDLILKNVREFIEDVENNNGILDPTESVAHFVSSISGSLLLGKSCSRDDPIWKTLINHLNELTNYAAMAGPLNFLPFLRFLPNFKQTVSMIKYRMTAAHDIQNQIIQESKKTFNINDDCPSNLIHAFLLQMSKSSSNEFYNLEQLRFLIIDVFGASIETTVNAIIWGLLYLAAYPKVQDKVRHELHQILQGNLPQIGDLSNLPYTEATIAEVARIRSLVPLGFPHYTLEDTKVEDFVIPKNTMIMPLLWAIHMDPKTWKEPETFSPERFLNDEGQFYQPECFLPFQAGKRMCPGDEMAKMENFLFFATILQRFRIVKEDLEDVDLSAECGLTLLPKPQKLVFVKLN